MTKLSERIEACAGDTTELAAEMLTFVTGLHYGVETDGEADEFTIFCMDANPDAVWGNPLTDERAIAALEREYGKPAKISFLDDGNVLVLHRYKHGQLICAGDAPTETLARSAALVRALEVSRDL